MYKQGLEFTGKLLHVYCSPRGRCAFHITMPCSFLIAYVNPNSLIALPESKFKNMRAPATLSMKI